MKNHLLKFKIKSRVSPYWFWVYIYDSVEKLRIDNKKYKEQDDFIDCQAVCQPTERIVIEKGKPDRRYENIGIIRLLKNHGSMVSAHEVLHASLWNYRLENNLKANFGSNCGKKEETLCAIFGELFRDLTVKMYYYKVWQ